jgi:hypothetical protein
MGCKATFALALFATVREPLSLNPCPGVTRGRVILGQISEVFFHILSVNRNINTRDLGIPALIYKTSPKSRFTGPPFTR